MVSVVIPVYNKAASLRRAIQSVLRQDAPVEVIVVDDGSQDAPELVVREFGDAVTYLRQPNRGPSAARNHGARASHFPRLLFLDADDELLPGCLPAHLRCRTANPLARATVSLTRRLQETMRRRPGDFTRIGEYHYSRRYLHDIVSGVPACGICIDRDLHDTIGGFDEELRCWEITDFMSRLLAASPVVGFLEANYVTIHRDTGISQFRRLQDDPNFQALFAMKHLEHLHACAADERQVAVRQTLGTARSLLLTGATADGRRVLTALRRRCGWRAVAGPTYVMGLVPPTVLSAAARVYRRLIRRRRGIRRPVGEAASR
jgi:glycosyltransferase involved in cell wall biosynthesis